MFVFFVCVSVCVCVFMNVASFRHQLTLFGNINGKVLRKWYQNRGGLSVASSAVLIHWGLGCDLNPPQTPTLIQCEPVAPTTTPLYLFARTRWAMLCWRPSTISYLNRLVLLLVKVPMLLQYNLYCGYLTSNFKLLAEYPHWSNHTDPVLPLAWQKQILVYYCIHQ